MSRVKARRLNFRKGHFPLAWQLTLASLLCMSCLALTRAQDNEIESQTALSPNQDDCKFSGEFTQSKTLKGLDAPVESSGRFLFDCQRGAIWASLDPVEDALILTVEKDQQVGNDDHRKDNKYQAFRLLDDNLQRLSQQRASAITRLIMSLMSSDQTALASQFQQVDLGDNKFKLLPKKRRLKRAIESISLDLGDAGSNFGDSRIISIKDRNQQLTKISAMRLARYESLVAQNCYDSQLPGPACDLLYPKTVD